MFFFFKYSLYLYFYFIMFSFSFYSFLYNVYLFFSFSFSLVNLIVIHVFLYVSLVVILFLILYVYHNLLSSYIIIIGLLLGYVWSFFLNFIGWLWDSIEYLNLFMFLFIIIRDHLLFCFSTNILYYYFLENLFYLINSFSFHKFINCIIMVNVHSNILIISFLVFLVFFMYLYFYKVITINYYSYAFNCFFYFFNRFHFILFLSVLLLFDST